METAKLICEIVPVLALVMGGLYRVFSRINRLIVKIERVIKQVEPNGGASMNDRVRILESLTHDQTAQLNRIESNQNRWGNT